MKSSSANMKPISGKKYIAPSWSSWAGMVCPMTMPGSLKRCVKPLPISQPVTKAMVSPEPV